MNRRLSELVRVYDDALPGDFCDQTVRAFDRTSGAMERHDPVRQFDELVIDGSPEWAQSNLQLERAKEQALEQYCREVPGHYPIQRDFEAFRIKRYAASRQDQFREHVDAYDRISGLRYLVCFWYLNDVYEGGETVFTELDLKVRARRGRLIMFPPYWMYAHAGVAPISGDKYIISTYFLYR